MVIIGTFLLAAMGVCFLYSLIKDLIIGDLWYWWAYVLVSILIVGSLTTSVLGFIKIFNNYEDYFQPKLEHISEGRAHMDTTKVIQGKDTVEYYKIVWNENKKKNK